MAHWLFVVRRDRPRLYAYLRDAFAGVEPIEVIVDRRHDDRPVDVDRRRVPLSKAEQELWDVAGFRLVYRDDDFGIFRTEEPPSATGDA
ncbi:MAG TPA: hypothetical protein VLF95_06855 [Vicinamibacteria bacterium]|nr:hypothetical protein [Vicinamibacteria bacterium]